MLEAGGVTTRANCAFQGFDATATAGPSSARTDQGELSADLFVIATGAWTPLLERSARLPDPDPAGKGIQPDDAPARRSAPRSRLIFPETRVAVTPFQSGYRLGSTMEFAGYDESIRPERLQLLKDGASPLSPRALLRAGRGEVVRLAADDL